MITTLLEKVLPSSLASKLLSFDKELLKGGGIFFISKLIGIVFTYLFTWYGAQKFGVGHWGAISLMLNTIQIGAILCLFGLDVLMIKYISIYFDQNQKSLLREYFLRTFSLSLFLAVTTCILLVLFPVTFSKFFYGKDYFVPWLTCAAIGIPAFVSFQLLCSSFAGIKDMLSYGVFKNIILFLATLVVFQIADTFLFPLYLNRYRESGILFLLTYVVVIYASSIVALLIFNKKTQLFFGRKKRNLSTKSIISQSYPLFVTASLSIIVAVADYFMISHFESQVEVGLYDIAYKISMATLIFLMAVSAIATPQFSSLFKKKDFNQLRKIVGQSAKIVFWGSIPLNILFLFFAEELLSFFGQEFILAKQTLIILLIGQLFNATCGIVGHLLNMTNNQKIFQNIVLSAAIINIVMNYFLIPLYGINGAATASAFSLIYVNLVSVYFAYKKLNMLTLHIPFLIHD